MEKEINKSYICYMIHHNFQNTYVGITNDFNHRLKQHNGIIRGGAKATKKFEDWTLGFYISGFEDKNSDDSSFIPLECEGFAATFDSITHEEAKKVVDFFTREEAKKVVLSFEWHMHHPNGKRKKDNSSKNYYGVFGRLRALCEVLAHDKFEHIVKKLKLNIKRDLYEKVKKEDNELFELFHSFIEVYIID